MENNLRFSPIAQMTKLKLSNSEHIMKRLQSLEKFLMMEKVKEVWVGEWVGIMHFWKNWWINQDSQDWSSIKMNWWF